MKKVTGEKYLQYLALLDDVAKQAHANIDRGGKIVERSIFCLCFFCALFPLQPLLFGTYIALTLLIMAFGFYISVQPSHWPTLEEFING